MGRTHLVAILHLPAAFLPIQALSGYPIPPVTLWHLTKEADLIVLASVDRILEGDEPWARDRAVLAVRETWKGESFKECEVRFSSNIVCPAQPVYRKGKTVLAFLKRTEDKKHEWWTVGLSYGTLYPGSDDVKVFRERVVAALKLQAKNEVREEERLEWTIETAARRATRWHGLYDLVPASDRLHFYYDRKYEKEREKRSSPKPPRRQLDRLARGFTTEPDLGPTFPMMLVSLKELRHRGVDATAVALVDRLLERRTLPRGADQAMALVMERLRLQHDLAEKEPEDPLLKDPLLSEREKSDEELRAIWKRARSRMNVADTKLPATPEPEVRGVGETTPP